MEMQTVTKSGPAHHPIGDGFASNLNEKPHPVRWMAEEYYKIYEAGLFRGKRVELIKGAIIQMSPMLSLHATSIQLVMTSLSEVFEQDFVVRPQLPISLGRFDEPEPNVAVVAGTIRDYTDAHPTSALLLVEVALTSLHFDRTKKLRLYAENRIEDYWTLNLKQRQLEFYRDPQGDAEAGFSYGEKRVFGEADSVAPLTRPGAGIKDS